MGNIGSTLRQARLAAQLPLPALAARTKIRQPLLEAIEREAFDTLPAGLLRRGYLRAYAREVGLDPEDIVRAYVEAYESEPPPVPQPAAPEPSSQWAQWIAIAGLAAVAVVLGTYANVSEPAEPLLPANPIAASMEVRMPEAAAPQPAAAPDVVPAARIGGLTIDIQPTADVWVEVTADGERVLYDLIRAGERRTVRALDEIALRVGDAGAFAYAINGTPGRPLGGAAQVRTAVITPQNQRTFTTSP